MKTLHLTVTAQPFEVMVTGEKYLEFRKPTQWIKQRMYHKDGTPKTYDVVKITNGYNRDRPNFIAKFICFGYSDFDYLTRYTNGLSVEVEKGDVIIYLGKVIKVENYG